MRERGSNAVAILDQIYAECAGPERQKRLRLMRANMRAVVNNNIERPKARKRGVALIGDHYLYLVLFVLLAYGVNVHTDNLGLRSKVLLPKLQRAAVVDANLEDANLGALVPGEVSLVNVQVVNPFVYLTAFMQIEQPVQVAHERS